MAASAQICASTWKVTVVSHFSAVCAGVPILDEKRSINTSNEVTQAFYRSHPRPALRRGEDIIIQHLPIPFCAYVTLVTFNLNLV